MRGKILLALGLAVVCVLGGCGDADGGESASRESSMESGQPVSGDAEPQQSVEDMAGDPAVVELSEEEKTFFTEWVQKNENYGFFLSEYDAPEDVNLEEVLYGGAGFGEGIPDEDVPLFLAETQTEELYTDCTKMRRQDIEEFLQSKLGLGLEDMSRPLELVYLAETDAYYNQAGDTNYTPFICTGGFKQGDTYTLYCTPANDWYAIYEDCETVLVKTGEDYHFVSNRFLAQPEPEGSIEG